MASSDTVDKQLTPQTPVLTVACRILRSPSHESVTTDLSLFSVSSVASDAHAGRRLLSFSKCDNHFARGNSPNPENRTQNRPADIPEILWFEEETELIRSCAALSSAVGLQKSFSTSDISQLPSPEEGLPSGGLRNAVSELALNSLQRSGFFLENARLDYTSRSCSTWVAVGDIASTSQLPSPHGGQSTTLNTQTAASTPPPPVFTAADFIRSVNKKVRQNYIRRRLLTTYKALERLSQSEFNLDRLEVTPSTAAASITNESGQNNLTNTINPGPTRLTVPGSSPTLKLPTPTNSTDAAMLRIAKQRASKNLPLTIRDVERERGKPLSKYERNMMVFNWLHTLDDNAYAVEGI